MEERKIPLRVTAALINALNSGTTPRMGLEHIIAGRKKEVEVLLNNLDNVKDGGSFFKFIVGQYGSGKSFLLQAIRNYAINEDFVVMDVDLNPERRLCGTGNRGLMTYRSLMTSMTIKAKPKGGALESIIQRWLNKLTKAVSKETGSEELTSFNKGYVQSAVRKEIGKAVSRMDSMVYEYDFTRVMEAYWDGYVTENDDLKKNALKWFRGEYEGKTEAKRNLLVSNMVLDTNWFSFIKLWAEFVHSIGYSGLVVFFDEAKTLANISSSVGRNNNYECLLSMFNDATQGRASYLGILMSGTDEFMDDTRRGLFSYPALRSRLEDGRYAERNGKRNWDAPLIPLKVLTNEEIFILMDKLREIHGLHYGYTPRITDENLEELLNETINRVGSSTNLTAREVTKNTMNILGILYHNPDVVFDEKLLRDEIGAPDEEEEDFLIDD